jgi:5-methylcytosine-specific restriction endonuclease McrA
VPGNKHYQSAKHKGWREKVLRKAKYLCVECARYGRNREATHAHHIKPIDEHPELAFLPSNGEALCSICHNKVEPRKRS